MGSGGDVGAAPGTEGNSGISPGTAGNLGLGLTGNDIGVGGGSSSGGGGWDQGMAANAAFSVVPVIGPVNALSAAFGGPNVGGIAQGDPSIGQGVNGPEGGGGVGGGPASFQNPTKGNSGGKQSNSIPNFILDPQQAQNDINMYSNWGPSSLPITSSMAMNQNSMYGSFAPVFNWGNSLRYFK